MEITTSRDQVVEEELSDQEEVRENFFFLKAVEFNLKI